MSKEGAGPREDSEPGRPAGTDKVVPEGGGDVAGISDLTYRIITPYLRNETLHRVSFIVLVALYANAAVTHVFALLLGQNKRGFAATFTACAYAFAPLALLNGNCTRITSPRW